MGGLGTQKRGGGAPRALDSPQLSLSALPGDSVSSDNSLSLSPSFLFRKSRDLAVLHPRESVHASPLLRDEAPQAHSPALRCATPGNRTEGKRARAR